MRRTPRLDARHPKPPTGPAPRSGGQAPTGLLAATALAVLSACGGGGGSETTTPVAPPVLVVKTTLSGVAATGAAMAGATVRVKCVAGNASATTTTSGSYTVELNDATLPCVVSATSSDGATVLHSLVNPSGGLTQTIHVNPLTELLVARVAAGASVMSPAGFYSGFGPATAAGVTAASITAATASVVATLRVGGVDFSAVGNPITAPLTAATATTAGNAYDQALDALAARLRSANTSLAEFAAQVAAAAAPAGAANTTAGLPLALLLQPASPTCASLRSGTYRLVVPDETDPSWSSSLIQINAATGVITFRDGSTGTALPDAKPCTFRNDSDNLRVVVSAGGVVVWTSLAANGRQGMAIAFPEQPATAADLAGNWNVLEFSNIQSQTTTPLWINDFTQAEFAADGRHLSLLECFGLQPCTPLAGPLGTVRVSTQGGLDYVNADGSAARIFIYRPASGDPMMVLVQPNRLLAIGSQRRTAAARALDETWGTYALGMVSNGTAGSAFTDVDYRVSAVDAATQTYTRRAVADGNSQPFTTNKPRDGLIYRAAGTSTLTSGQVVSFGDLIVMPLPGTGLSVYGSVTIDSTRNQGGFGFAVAKP